MKFNKAIWLLIFVFGVLCAFKLPRDPDYGWHFRYGQYFVQTGHLLHNNLFSYNFTDYKWANSYWISQAVIYVTHNNFGDIFAGLLFSAVLTAATITYVKHLTVNVRAPLPIKVVVSLLLLTVYSIYLLTVRPMFFSTIYLMILILILFRYPSNKYIWILPLLFLIWANSHADYVFGLFIFGIYVAEKMVGTYFKSVKKNLPVILAGVASVAITLINPYGFNLWRTLIKESHPYQFMHIGEWVPVDIGNKAFFVFCCAILGIILASLISERRNLPVWYVLTTGLFCIFSIRSQYFLRIAVIIGTPAILLFLSNATKGLLDLLPYSTLKGARNGFFLFIMLSVLISCSVFALEIEKTEDKLYPKKALNYAVLHNISGNIFNYYGWGGYMIWKYPQIKTFVDGRMPSWREGTRSVFEDSINISDEPEKYSKLLSNYSVTWILYPTENSFTKYLKTDSNWQEVYSDDIATIFVIINP